MNGDLATFLNKWQTLAGSALGVFSAVTVAIGGFWLRGRHENWKRRKHEIGIVEASLAQSLNDLWSVRNELKAFVRRLRDIVQALQQEGEQAYSFNQTNFPHFAEVFSDSKIRHVRLGSYYLHNRLLQVDSLIRYVNHQLQSIRYDYGAILKSNEFMLSLSRDKQPDGITPLVTPVQQRTSYAGNLDMFIDGMNILRGHLKGHYRLLAETKHYNILLGKYRRFVIWKHESISFKYFRNREAIEKYTGLSSLDRLSSIFESAVNTLIDKSEVELNDAEIA